MQIWHDPWITYNDSMVITVPWHVFTCLFDVLTIILPVRVDAYRILLRSYVEEASKRRVGPFSLMTIYVLVVERAREACLPRSDFTSPSALQPQRFGICHGASLPGAGARLRSHCRR